MNKLNDRKIEVERVNLSSMIHEISEQLKVQRPYRQIEVQIEPNLMVMADPHLIRLALDNLMSNAFKYTGKKDRALIQFGKLKIEGSMVSFFIKDNGDGFEASQAQRLFRPLVRLHDESEFPGIGLGLASVARIIEVHGGSIHAAGEKSKGATFFFDLPLAPADS